MREPGNIVAARVVTLEETPRVIELRGDAAQKISRAFGTTGIITVLEMPLAPAQPWIDVIVAFDDFIDAVRFGHAIAMADGIVKKLLTPVEWPLPQHFSAFRASCPDGKSLLIGMIGEMSIESFETLLAPFGGTDHLQGAERGRARQDAALRARLEPYDAADAQDRPRRHLSAMPLSA